MEKLVKSDVRYSTEISILNLKPHNPTFNLTSTNLTHTEPAFRENSLLVHTKTYSPIQPNVDLNGGGTKTG